MYDEHIGTLVTQRVLGTEISDVVLYAQVTPNTYK